MTLAGYYKQRQKIKDLTSCERLAEYMIASSKLAMVGARLRKNNRDDKTWTTDENKEWNDAADELDPWYYSLTTEEKDKVKKIEIFMADITCARV